MSIAYSSRTQIQTKSASQSKAKPTVTCFQKPLFNLNFTNLIQFSSTCLTNPNFLLSMAASPKTENKLFNNSISVSKVRVIVRVRPFLGHDNGDPVSCISLLDQDFESQHQEVAVYLKDPQTRFKKISLFYYYFE